ncbi:hypothetical protein GCM10025867_11410 [Frondihabitans sucicola]|uniref:Elongation factor G-binding protein C-terminal treble-clef zinc-finger domain-containing protein n=1 Tax=Frondihabitans sucicola TaxID=1268041 RepID=A0ABN6XZ28_9MICO|nr:FBP domain-containing protein [Frondihabitans sucicola]BDZ48900.1 hypothetical protein GCM10025867_11410 [Frondihabitans sucicola]
MLPLTEKIIRASFANASRKEVSVLTLPPDFDELDWEAVDYLGWRDPKMSKRSYVVVPSGEGEVTAILLREADARPAARAQCTWCQDVKLPNDVVFFSAKRAGAAGRNGDTVGTLVCAEFQCSTNVRRPVPPAYLGFDVDAAREERILALRERAAAFAENVLRPS